MLVIVFPCWTELKIRSTLLQNASSRNGINSCPHFQLSKTLLTLGKPLILWLTPFFFCSPGLQLKLSELDQIIWNKILCGVLTLQMSQCPSNPTLLWQIACLMNILAALMFSLSVSLRWPHFLVACSQHHDFKQTRFLKTSSHAGPVSIFYSFLGAMEPPPPSSIYRTSLHWIEPFTMWIRNSFHHTKWIIQPEKI